MNKYYRIVMLEILICFSAFVGQSQTVNWEKFIAKQDLIWNNNVDSDFFNGAFIGDGVQGAMIMKDTINPNGLRMLLAHYKAISHYTIPDFEYCDSKVYAGNIIITPAGTSINNDMRMNIFDGETNGIITTDKGTVNWRAFADRKHNVFIIELKGENGEVDAKVGVREEWGITPRFYLEKNDATAYANHLPPKPVLTKQGDIDLVINKMKSRGAHVLASQLIKKEDGTQILYVSIGTNDDRDVSKAAIKATTDAVERVQAAVIEGYEAITLRHHKWWNKYMQSSYLKIEQDPYWEKFWYLQLYKFASASAEDSDLIMDTQGTWITESAWAGVWWNLNVQLSYMPMYTANKLGVGRSFINGMDRIYKSGAFNENANGVGITVGRSTTYEGLSNWGDEFGNMPWVLQMYWKYWKFSGEDSIALSLFSMLKDNAVFFISNLNKGADGKYHLANSRSPEYEELGGGALHEDTNYGLMGAKWVFQTLLDMDEELSLNDEQSHIWQDILNNLTEFPTDANGLRVDKDQGFNFGHRHPAHLLGIYPLHIINPDQGKNETELIEKSLDRWQRLTQEKGFGGYTFTLGSPMYATLGNGDKALSTLNLSREHNLFQPNTMYEESGGAVIETPLSAVESIAYMLLQSWNGIIRIFPALPSSWENVSFENFRAEGAFLVSASSNQSVVNNVIIESKIGKTCTMLNPWAGKILIVKDDDGNIITVTQEGDKFIFPTQAGKKYFITAPNSSKIKSK
ncbi:glycosyl hydrolase family 95 catalytic domain-containing protein [Flagellimonas sp. 2504JD4-2]